VKRAALGTLVLTLVTLLVALAPAAQAHTGLVSSDPADGAVLASAPANVVLVFDEAMLEAAVTISDADGTVVSSPNSTVADATVTVPWPGGLPDGSYAVNYRVVSTDGHPVDGAIALAFGVGVTLDPAVRPVQEDDGSSLPLLAIGAGFAIGAGIALFYAARRRSRPAA
jgi:methionine-rich copper-binding protein CopC